MQIKDCSCPGRPEDKPVALTNAILTFCCARCGGGLASVAGYLHAITLQVEKLRADLYQALGDVPAPGKAVIAACSECRGQGCTDCGNVGKVLWRACPKCGDTGFDFVNGRGDTDGMICRIGCGFSWAADDPRWLAQRLPGRAEAA